MLKDFPIRGPISLRKMQTKIGRTLISLVRLFGPVYCHLPSLMSWRTWHQLKTDSSFHWSSFGSPKCSPVLFLEHHHAHRVVVAPRRLNGQVPACRLLPNITTFQLQRESRDISDRTLSHLDFPLLSFQSFQSMDHGPTGWLAKTIGVQAARSPQLPSWWLPILFPGGLKTHRFAGSLQWSQFHRQGEACFTGKKFFHETAIGCQMFFPTGHRTVGFQGRMAFSLLITHVPHDMTNPLDV